MISVRLIGGLGNQMFIYAFAKAIERRGFPASIATYEYANQDFEKFADATYEYANQDFEKFTDATQIRSSCDIRNPEILFFDLSLPIDRSPQEKFKNIEPLWIRIAKRLNDDFCLRFSRLIAEDHHIFQKEDFPFFINPCAHLLGYFQELRYFEHIRSDLLKDFTLKKPLSFSNQNLKDEIAKTPNSCFLHIRRGDYLKEEHWMFVELGSVYYENAIRAIKRHISHPNFFIFSNEIAWCKEHFLQSLSPEVLKGANFYFIDQNGEGDAIEEMELMRTCQNGIIANSTFSWWAAYLIENPSKVIIAPTRFHYYESITQKLIPRKKDDGKWIAINFTWKER